MGSPEDVGNSDEHPQRGVAMSSFWMGQTEVSINDYMGHLHSEFQSAVRRFDLTRILELSTTAIEMYNGYRCSELNGKGGNYPVVCLVMKEKEYFCHAQGAELPTAAQSKFAARFDKEDIPGDKLVIWDNGFRSTEPVAIGVTNRFGVYHLLGNVWESYRDAYERDYYSRMPGKDPYNPLTAPYDYETNPQGQGEECGGFSFNDVRRYARAANRYNVYPDFRYNYDGFRCVRSSAPGLPKK